MRLWVARGTRSVGYVSIPAARHLCDIFLNDARTAATRYRSTVRKATSGHALEPKQNRQKNNVHDACRAHYLHTYHQGSRRSLVTGGVTGIAGSAVALQAALR